MYRSLNVCGYILYYLNKSLAFRAAEAAKETKKKHTALLSWATKRPVTYQSID